MVQVPGQTLIIEDGAGPHCFCENRIDGVDQINLERLIPFGQCVPFHQHRHILSRKAGAEGQNPVRGHVIAARIGSAIGGVIRNRNRPGMRARKHDAEDRRGHSTIALEHGNIIDR